MLVTLLGIVTLVRLVQPSNASSPMLVTLLGIVTLVRLVQSAERLVPDAGDAVGDRVASGFAPGHWMSVVWLLLNKTPSTLL